MAALFRNLASYQTKRSFVPANWRGLATASETLRLGQWFKVDPKQVDEAYEEVTRGKGYYVLKGGFSQEEITAARERTHHLALTESPKATHFTAAKADRQKRVWNVLNKGDMFQWMVQHPFAMALLEKLLGDDFCLGSIAANCLLPGATGQEPHLDYPYWDYFNKKHWPANPKRPDAPFFMNTQCNVLLTDFTKENGASGCVPGTQLEARWPDAEEFFKKVVQIEGKAGDMVFHTGLLQHCAMPNNSNMIRSAMLLQYLPKFVKPMEDMKLGVVKHIRDGATPRLRQLLALDYPYPQLLDDAEAKNREGATAYPDYPTKQ